MASEDEMRRRLKAEIDRMSDSQLKNVTKSENSFMSWVKSALKRIWHAVVDSTIVAIGSWLWHSVFG